MPRLGPRRQAPADGATRVVGAGEVGADDVVEAVVLAVLVLAADAARSHERMHWPELVDGARDSVLDALALANVARCDTHGTADAARSLLEPPLVSGEQRHRSAVAGHATRNGPPDPRPGTGHDHVSLSHVFSNRSQFA